MSKRIAVKKKVTKSAPKNPRQQFNAYCQKIRQLQEKATALHQDQENVLAHFQEKILPLERKYVDTVYQKIERLITFIPRKTLPAYQFDDLLAWIEEDIRFLEDYPFADHVNTDQLRDMLIDSYPDAMKPSFGDDDIALFREMLEIKCPSLVGKFTDEEVIYFLNNPRAFGERLDEEFSSTQTSEEESVEDDDDDFSFFDDEEEDWRDSQAQQKEKQQDISALFNTTAANRLYKKLAILFHPDREMDETVKKEKHHLMVQLSKAKKDNDIWTIIELYQQHIDPNGGFEEKDLPAINSLLAAQIETLKFNYQHEERTANPVTSIVWAKFGNESQKVIDKNFAQHIKHLKQVIKDETLAVEEIKSLKVLKHYLAERYEESMAEQQFFFKEMMKSFR